MNTTTTSRLLLLAAVLALAACGNKGPLVHPDQAASPASPASTATDAKPHSALPATETVQSPPASAASPAG